ncbi:succinate dehydrogenase cytochrome b subunit [Algoriphagus halophytocola]|uniref:Succinate dehydrogenase cytochrome b subunit n=1 Tax=Algoriphagus halophytocola TaxID=2991499 RepID=A0ABY6MN86_9BACT|nr:MULTISPECIES: succinate dehydrogenase cytochrome b subunit [unclassified Algoriphagus]UZD24610.1 succinate dehydrogenase cytochrome b subunit [Algoriphagus sp. TR-M5]WBL41978.1 succinate dehydrogenase cytochrome b subunit [Algoriphagus sp. TR-M9]
MSWVTKTLSSTIGRKLIMALTGLFLILFLTGHVSGNLLLFKNDGGEAFNIYAKFMTTNPAVKLLSYLTYISIIGHVIFSIWLSRRNKAARPVGYGVSTPPSTTLSSRNMGILGTIILIFIVVHMQSFWAQMHWGDLPMVSYDGEQYKDLYSIVTFAFQNELMVIGYVVAMAFLAFHLSHGFASAFQTLGLNHQKYSPAIALIGKIYCILVPVLFASMPVYIYFTQS